jgi:hypothetical protein
VATVPRIEKTEAIPETKTNAAIAPAMFFVRIWLSFFVYKCNFVLVFAVTKI